MKEAWEGILEEVHKNISLLWEAAMFPPDPEARKDVFCVSVTLFHLLFFYDDYIRITKSLYMWILLEEKQCIWDNRPKHLAEHLVPC